MTLLLLRLAPAAPGVAPSLRVVVAVFPLLLRLDRPIWPRLLLPAPAQRAVRLLPSSASSVRVAKRSRRLPTTEPVGPTPAENASLHYTNSYLTARPQHLPAHLTVALRQVLCSLALRLRTQSNSFCLDSALLDSTSWGLLDAALISADMYGTVNSSAFAAHLL